MPKTDAEHEEFLAEYVALCRKHGIMVYSDGESVWTGEMEERDYEDPWWVVKESRWRLERQKRKEATNG